MSFRSEFNLEHYETFQDEPAKKIVWFFANISIKKEFWSSRKFTNINPTF